MVLHSGDDYVALGSSFAAGPGLRPRSAGAPRPSGRSDVNYAHLLARKLQLNLRDVTFSGATTGELLAGINHPSQVESIGESTRLVTVTAGGNDVGYLPALTFASLPRPLRDFGRMRRRVAEAIDPARTSRRFETLEGSLTALVAEIRRRAPEAEILFVDYLTILPPADAQPPVDDDILAPLTADLVGWGRGVANTLSETLQRVAAAEGILFTPVGELSRGHHAWSAEPWTRKFHPSLRGGAPYHPNAEGMAAVAVILEQQLA